jgi:hypothetical protein
MCCAVCCPLQTTDSRWCPLHDAPVAARHLQRALEKPSHQQGNQHVHVQYQQPQPTSAREAHGEQAGGEGPSARALSAEAGLQRYECPCGSEWPTQKSFAGHCGQCEVWREQMSVQRRTLCGDADDITLPAGPANTLAALQRGTLGGEAARLMAFHEASFARCLVDYDAFPAIAQLMSRNDANFICERLSAQQLKVYIERFGE